MWAAVGVLDVLAENVEVQTAAGYGAYRHGKLNPWAPLYGETFPAHPDVRCIYVSIWLIDVNLSVQPSERRMYDVRQGFGHRLLADAKTSARAESSRVT